MVQQASLSWKRKMTLLIPGPYNIRSGNLLSSCELTGPWEVWYRKTSNISHTLVYNKIFDHSDVVGASPVGADPTTSSDLISYLASMDCVKTTARRDENCLSFEIWCDLYKGFYGSNFQKCSILTCYEVHKPFHEIALRWILQNTLNDCQHWFCFMTLWLSQCWPRKMLASGVTRP